MDGKFRLIFRGEVLEGQHRAVVKRRLAEALKLDAARVEKLFSGKPVVLKRSADKETAARYQRLFKEAGGRLRVLEEEPAGEKAAGTGASGSPGAGPEGGKTRQAQAQAAQERAVDPGRPAANPAIDAPDFAVQTTYFPEPAEPAREIHAPDFGLAEVGAPLAEDAPPAPAMVVEVDFELAEPGVDLLDSRPVTPAVALGPLDFELAEPGARIGPAPGPVTAAAPDVSHLRVLEA